MSKSIKVRFINSDEFEDATLLDSGKSFTLDSYRPNILYDISCAAEIIEK